MAIHIYKNTGEFVHSLNYTREEFMEHRDKTIDGYKFYDWTDDLMISDELFVCPIVDSLNGELREMTEKEKIENGKYELQDGEIFDGSNIIMTPRPTDALRPIWDKESSTWVESATEKDIMLKVYNDRLSFINSEMRDTDSFELGAYRRNVKALGDDIKEMDEYRDSLIETKYELISAIENIDSPKGRSKRSAEVVTYADAKKSITNTLERPKWSSKYK